MSCSAFAPSQNCEWRIGLKNDALCDWIRSGVMLGTISLPYVPSAMDVAIEIDAEADPWLSWVMSIGHLESYCELFAV